MENYCHLSFLLHTTFSHSRQVSSSTFDSNPSSEFSFSSFFSFPIIRGWLSFPLRVLRFLDVITSCINIFEQKNTCESKFRSCPFEFVLLKKKKKKKKKMEFPKYLKIWSIIYLKTRAGTKTKQTRHCLRWTMGMRYK